MSINFTILGSGVSASLNAKAIINLPEIAHLNGFFSVDKKSSADFAKKFGIIPYASFNEMLSDKETDTVIICTPSGLHAEHTVAAMKAGKNVLIEKPAVISHDQAESVLKTEKECKVKAATVSQLRLYSDVVKLKNDISNGVYGKITLANLNMHYFRPQEYYDSAAWRGTVKYDGGTLMNQGLHGIDLLLYLFGPVSNVSAFKKTAARKIEAEDTAAAVLEFKSGLLCTVSASSCTYPGAPRTLEICGTDGSAVLTENKITFCHNVIDGLREDKRSDYLSYNDPAAVPEEAHREVIKNYIEYLVNNTPPVSTLVDGCNSAMIIEAIYRASETGKIIEPYYYI